MFLPSQLQAVHESGSDRNGTFGVFGVPESPFSCSSSKLPRLAASAPSERVNLVIPGSLWVMTSLVG